MENLQANEGIVWKIDRFALQEGPGIRTNLYFKGCALRCEWCSNPEGQTSIPEVVLFSSRCNSCGLCAERCPHQAIWFQHPSGTDKTNLQITRSKCNLCGVCVSVCLRNALEIWGRKYSIGELVDILERDRSVHKRSGGGVTCTGGDPLFQSGFTLELLKACRKRGIHMAIETCGYVDEEPFRAILKEVDWLCIDLKHMSCKDHLLLTGKRNDLILRNLRLASSMLAVRQRALVIRMVVVPGVNDNKNIYEMAAFLRTLPFITIVELLPYHAYGVYKYDLLGHSYNLKDITTPTTEVMARYNELLESEGIAVAQ